MDTVVVFLFGALVVYGAIGFVAGLAFVTYGIGVAQPAPVTVGARILLLPGAMILWPAVISRWRVARSQR